MKVIWSDGVESGCEFLDPLQPAIFRVVARTLYSQLAPQLRTLAIDGPTGSTALRLARTCGTALRDQAQSSRYTQ